MATMVRCLIICAASLLTHTPVSGATDLDEQRSRLYSAYAGKLFELTQWCRANDLPKSADLVTGWLPRREPTKLTLFLIDEEPTDDGASSESSAVMRRWHQRFESLRHDQARLLLQLARQAVNHHRPSLAYQLVTEAVREDPDYSEARQILGYQLLDGAWRTDYGRRKIERGHVWHRRFGWLKQQDVARYEAGERRFGKNWIDAHEDDRRRQNIKKGWRIVTDHYRITTNHRLEAGVQLAVKLERLRQIWQQVFTEYYAGDLEVSRWFDGHHQRPHPRYKLHAIHYYQDRDQYNAALRQDQPMIDRTLGIYFDRVRRGYFFAGEDQSPGTLYHEGTHQLFHETRQVAKQIGRLHNFWIVEGIATYMESLTEHNGYWTLGGLDAGRVPAARQRLLEDNFYLPLADLTRMGKLDLQHHPEIKKIYSQAAGLATFLMHDYDGRYRDALLQYLVAVYTDKANPTTLEKLTGVSYAQLDRQYREWLSR